MLACPALLTSPLDTVGAFSCVLGNRVRLHASITLPGSMSSQHAVVQARSGKSGEVRISRKRLVYAGFRTVVNAYGRLETYYIKACQRISTPASQACQHTSASFKASLVPQTVAGTPT